MFRWETVKSLPPFFYCIGKIVFPIQQGKYLDVVARSATCVNQKSLIFRFTLFLLNHPDMHYIYIPFHHLKGLAKQE